MTVAMIFAGTRSPARRIDILKKGRADPCIQRYETASPSKASSDNGGDELDSHASLIMWRLSAVSSVRLSAVVTQAAGITKNDHS